MMLATVGATAAALPTLVGWRATAGGRWMNGSAVAQALAWGAFMLARPLHDRLFSSLWIGLLGLSLVCIWHALDAWLMRRPGRALVHAVALITPLGYGLGFDSYAFRVGWSNFGLALLLGCVALGCAWPAQGIGRRWRAVVLVSALALALVTLSRGVLGAFFTELYPTLRTPHPLNVAGAMVQHVALALITLGLLAAWHDEASRALQRLAATDGLTGLLNRRACLEQAATALATSRRYREPLAVLLLDLDHFKQINDTLGHEAGDTALRLMAEQLQLHLRPGDLSCRYGGEEFLVLLRRCAQAQAMEVDARLREALQRATQAHMGRTVSFSSGLALCQDGDIDIQPLLHRADMALYEAKRSGRGRLAMAA
ncbi:GGDEF domain-containing protein [Azohydromonas lata]|uniref:diguanylate cyclase n=1 Tax=Azohydromonas lata TaxID=45677 RepID=A0ABU5ICK4_9BURK|nr:GGDEF domain-containing protein [Azohydromonas lata]MDZ5456842.1 GGDEF domain-containing protein [Azohydromonas lata]